MVKKLKCVPLVCLALANLVLAMKNGFNWLNVLSLILSLIVLIWDIAEVLCDGGK